MSTTEVRHRAPAIGATVLVTAALSVALVVGLGHRGSNAASSRSAPPGASATQRSSGSPASVWDVQQALDGAADAVTAVLRADPNYTGVAVDAQNNRLIGYGVRPFDATTWTKAGSLMPKGSTLQYVASRLTQQQVTTLTDYLSKRQHEGLPVTSWGLSRLDGPFEVGVQPGKSLPAADLTYLNQYGAGTVHLTASTGPVAS